MTLLDYTAATGDTALTADAVVVGSGPGGAATSRVLAEAGLRVVVLEEGPARPNFRPNLAHTNRHHMQEGGAMVARGRQFLPIAAGRGVGGGSLVNSALSFRTPDNVLDGWTAALGHDRYSPAAMGPIFDELGEILQIAITPDRVAGENNRLIVRGVEKLGLRGGLAPRNTPGCSGCGFCNFGCPVGGKASVDKNLIPMARDHGATVQADTKVDAILVEADRAAGVVGTVHHPETREAVGRITVRAPRVFICAGGVGTPRLLHHAGLAARLGPAVGRGLHIHPGSAVLGECDHEVHMWRGATQGAYFESDDHPGLLPHTLCAPPGAILLLMRTLGVDVKAAMARIPFLSGCIAMISDKGAGTVGAHSDGTANITYTFAEHDLQRIKDGMVLVAEVLLAGGASRLFAPVHGVGVHTSATSFGAALADRRVEDFTLYASHPMASCRMGRDVATSVVDPAGEAHNLPGLFIADSSVFPTSLGVNPQYTTMTLATVIARHIAARG